MLIKLQLDFCRLCPLTLVMTVFLKGRGDQSGMSLQQLDRLKHQTTAGIRQTLGHVVEGGSMVSLETSVGLPFYFPYFWKKPISGHLMSGVFFFFVCCICLMQT